MVKIIKILLVGKEGVGKTAILEQYIHGTVAGDKVGRPTLEDSYMCVVESDKAREHVRFMDLGGAELVGRLGQVASMDAYLLVFNPSKPDTLDWLLLAKQELDKHRDKREVVYMVLANHQAPGSAAADPAEALVSRANSWASRERMDVWEVRATDRSSLVQPMAVLASRLAAPAPKSTFSQFTNRKKE